jgi:hypothetical protein
MAVLFLTVPLPARLHGPSHVALFAYDSNTFIAQSFRHNETDMRLGVTGGFTKLRHLVTDEVIARQAPQESGPGR